jgi:large subunit ribosomal protein L28
MMIVYRCERCQKGLQVGMNVSHSHRRTKKHSLPNLHIITVKVDGRNRTMRLCTKCTRIIRSQYPFKPTGNLQQVKTEKKEIPVKEEEVETEAKEIVGQEA